MGYNEITFINKSTITYVIAALIMGFVVSIIRLLIGNLIISFVVGVVVGTTVYFVVLMILQEKVTLFVLNKIKKLVD